MSAVTSVKIVGPIKLPCTYPGTCLSSIKSFKQITIALENEGVQIMQNKYPIMTKIPITE